MGEHYTFENICAYLDRISNRQDAIVKTACITCRRRDVTAVMRGERRGMLICICDLFASLQPYGHRGRASGACIHKCEGSSLSNTGPTAPPTLQRPILNPATRVRARISILHRCGSIPPSKMSTRRPIVSFLKVAKLLHCLRKWCLIDLTAHAESAVVRRQRFI